MEHLFTTNKMKILQFIFAKFSFYTVCYFSQNMKVSYFGEIRYKNRAVNSSIQSVYSYKKQMYNSSFIYTALYERF